MRKIPPDAEYVGVAVIASTLDYERAKDGVFGACLIKLFRDGPDDSGLKKEQWTTKNVDVPVGCFFEALLAGWSDTSQIPKLVQVGLPLLRLPNPLYIPFSSKRMDGICYKPPGAASLTKRDSTLLAELPN